MMSIESFACDLGAVLVIAWAGAVLGGQEDCSLSNSLGNYFFSSPRELGVYLFFVRVLGRGGNEHLRRMGKREESE